MRQNLIVQSAIFLVAVFASLLVNSSPLGNNELYQLGAKQCTWGPSYWCQNITNAKGCNAVRHCIVTVWEKQNIPADNDSICQICKEMVTQARDQLRSNETMEELKQVFEGSCNLIPIKVVRKECLKLSDDFIPELIEALSSQMNPNQVCTVAGLCNNANIDKLLMNYYSAALAGTLTNESDEQNINNMKAEQPIATTEVVKMDTNAQKPLLTCGNCISLGNLLTQKLQSANRDDVLENILHICGQMSSFSDACSNIAISYFVNVYESIQNNFNADGICHLSGVCSAKYHQHLEDVEEDNSVDLVRPGKDDIPCELCQQLVHHLRDVLIANTTEAEFKQVLQGFCNQTRGFRSECLSIVDEYYDVIYKSLVNNLDENGACFLIGICPKGSKTLTAGEIRPLLPVLPPVEIYAIIRKKLGANEPHFNQEELKAMTLPIDKLMGATNPGYLLANGQLCTLCEYILHFIQESLATSSTEDEIKRTVNDICDKLPTSIKGQCHNFIDEYGDAVIALLIQGLDPRKVCPKMQMCPQNAESDDVEFIAPISTQLDEQAKPSCPLCLFAVAQAQEKIRDNKSKENVKTVLGHLCLHLPEKLQVECVDFVKTYSSELIDMLVTDFTPQEICTAVDLCETQDTNYLHELEIYLESDDDAIDSIDANKIDGNSEIPLEVVFIPVDENSAPNCILCLELVKLAEKRINRFTKKEEIIEALKHTCEKLRKNFQDKCYKYVDKYGDKMAELLIKEMEPKSICTELGLCLHSEQEDLDIDEALKYDVIAIPNHSDAPTSHDHLVDIDVYLTQSNRFDDLPSCVLCEFIMSKVELELKDRTKEEEIKNTVENVCKVMPNSIAKSCQKFIDQYAKEIIELLSTMPPKEICQQLNLCLANKIDKSLIANEIVECGVCHGVILSLVPFSKKHTVDAKNLTYAEIVEAGCENLPGKYLEMCSEMVRIYGKSIVNLAQRNETNICSLIGKCFQNERSSLAFARINE